MDDLPVTRGAWLPIEAAAEVLDLDAAVIRRWVAEGSLAARVVDGIEFVPLHELQRSMRERTSEKREPGSQTLEEE
jgi:hypothetical protein